MTLDSTDVDMQIEQLRTQIAQFNPQISQQQSINLGYTRAATQEKQARLDIAQAQVTESKSQAALQRALLLKRDYHIPLFQQAQLAADYLCKGHRQHLCTSL